MRQVKRKHIGILGNSPFTDVLCNKRVMKIVSILDLPDILTNEFCKLCIDLYKYGITRGAVKSRKIKKIELTIRQNLSRANRTPFDPNKDRYCDLAHQSEKQLFELMDKPAIDLLGDR